MPTTYGGGTYGADTFGGGAAVVDPPGSAGPVRFRYKVAVSITTADGRVLRYGPDEPRADGVPFATTYSSTIPGGHDQATFSLRTRITDELPFSLLDDVRIYGPGNVTLWEGYVTQLPRQSGDDFLVNVQCVGHSGRLKWETGFREIYIDRDVGSWQAPTVARRAAHNSIGQTVSGATEVAPDPSTGLNALVFKWERLAQAAGPTNENVIEAWYDAGGIDIGRLDYDYHSVAGLGAGWVAQAFLSTDDIATTTDAGTNHGAVSSNSLVNATASGRKWAFIQGFFNGAATGDGIWHEEWRDLAILGNHGLTLNSGGYYGQDVLEDVITRAGSGLTTDLSFNPFVILQLAFKTPVTAEDVILEVNKYFLYEWGCWGREFFWRPADPDRLTWEARMDQGAHLNLEGDEAGNAINGVIVSFSLPDGSAKTVGPVGSGLQLEDASLGDTSSSNTVNAHGIAKKYAKLDVSFPTTDSGAIAIGAAYLAQLSLPARKGSINLTGYVQHPTKGLRPVSEVRAGDWVRVSDSATPEVARRIVQVSHDADNRACQLDVGNDVDKVDAILQRVGIRSSLIG